MKLVHVTNRYDSKNQNERERNERARRTWYSLYGSSAGMIKGLEVRDLDRDATSIGEIKPVPFIKDLIEEGFKEGDCVMFTNSDSCLCKETGAYVFQWLTVRGACFSSRRDMLKDQRVWLSQSQIMDRGEKFVGVDLVAMTREWWEGNKAGYPDLLLSFEGWDWVFKFMMGKEFETPPLVYHQMHSPYWARHRGMSPGQLWNRRLCYEWAKSRSDFETIKKGWKSLESYARDGQVPGFNTPRATTKPPASFK